MNRTALDQGQTLRVLTRELGVFASLPKDRTETSTANSYDDRNRATGSRNMVTTRGCS
jgi:hypothetical protein